MRNPLGVRWFGRTRVAVGLIAAVGTLACPWRACAQPGGSELWGVNGTVLSMARAGNTLYVAGQFGAVGPCTGNGVPVSLGAGAPLRRYPRVSGEVNAAVSDGAGGWFIGGSFDAVEGQPRAHLAHILANGRLSSWNPVVVGVAVHALAREGHTLFVGGSFTAVNGAARQSLAAVDTRRGGVLLRWNPDPDGGVRCLLLDRGSLFVGGTFSTISGQPHANLARLRSRTGAAMEWRADTDARVLALASDGRTLWAGGEFDHMGPDERNSLAAVDLASGRTLGWDAHLGPRRIYIAHGNWYWPYVSALAIDHGVVYAGGSFSEAGGRTRNALAALDAATGEATPFDARLGATLDVVTALAVRRGALYVGGRFGRIAGVDRASLAALDLHTGVATDWNPRAAEDGRYFFVPPSEHRRGTTVNVIAPERDAIYAGGSFFSIGEWQARSGLAAIDLVTGRATDWAPVPSGRWVNSLGAIGSRVYLAGWFDSINGVAKHNIAAVDVASGQLVDWDPGPLGPISLGIAPTLVTRGNTVYVAGYFYGLGGQPCNHFAALDGTTGMASTWNAGADGDGQAVLPHGDAVYLAGFFGEMGGLRQPMLGAVDATTGLALPWAPKPTRMGAGYHWPNTSSLAAGAEAIFIAGLYASFGGEPRRGLAAVDPVSGAVRPWDPSPDGDVLALATVGHTVWVGGRFGTIADRSQPYLAALDDTDGRLLSPRPRLDAEVDALLADAAGVFICGRFRSLDGFPRSGIALIPAAMQAPLAQASSAEPAHPVLWLAAASPNPAKEAAVVRFALPQPSEVSLSVFDLQGRRVASVLDHSHQPAGEHVARIQTAGWAPGCYMYRLDVGARNLTKKLLVVR